MKPETQFDRGRSESSEQQAGNVVNKGGFLGRYLIFLIILCVLGIVILALLLLKR